MKNTSKILASFLTLTVFVAAAICCTPEHFRGQVKKLSCHCPAKGEKKNDQSCCLKKFPAEQIARFSLAFDRSINSALAQTALLKPQIVQKNEFNLAFLDGPPGPISAEPLYISSHNFRI